MLTIDYEVEYNNRARVPEHPAIFVRWDEARRGLSRGDVASRPR